MTSSTSLQVSHTLTCSCSTTCLVMLLYLNVRSPYSPVGGLTVHHVQKPCSEALDSINHHSLNACLLDHKDSRNSMSQSLCFALTAKKQKGGSPSAVNNMSVPSSPPQCAATCSWSSFSCSWPTTNLLLCVAGLASRPHMLGCVSTS